MSIFDYHHDNPPAPFNPSSDPRAKGWYNETSNSMEDDNFYDSHTREECKAEWKRRYEKIKNGSLV